MLELFWKSKAKAKKNEKGFTLVELIVVVAILGILAVIGITRFAGLTDNAREKADIATAASIASATQVHISEQSQKVDAFDWDQTDMIKELVTDGNYLDTPKDPQSIKGGKWSVKYGADNSLKVSVGDKQLYPVEPEEE